MKAGGHQTVQDYIAQRLHKKCTSKIRCLAILNSKSSWFPCCERFRYLYTRKIFTVRNVLIHKTIFVALRNRSHLTSTILSGFLLHCHNDNKQLAFYAKSFCRHKQVLPQFMMTKYFLSSIVNSNTGNHATNFCQHENFFQVQTSLNIDKNLYLTIQGESDNCHFPLVGSHCCPVPSLSS